MTNEEAAKRSSTSDADRLLTNEKLGKRSPGFTETRPDVADLLHVDAITGRITTKTSLKGYHLSELISSEDTNRGYSHQSRLQRGHIFINFNRLMRE